MGGRRLPTLYPVSSTPLCLHLHAGQAQTVKTSGIKTMSVFLFSFAILLRVSHASESVPPAQFGAPSLGFSSSVRPVCKPIPSTLSLCHGIGYRRMWIPNLLGHDSLKEAQQQSAAWLPLISKLCHRDTKKFLCSLFAPVCLPELSGPVSPCRSLCDAVRDGCVPVMSAFGFPWPEMFNCTRFPRGTELCIPATGEQEGRTDQEVRHEEALKGSVICDACSLAAEGETDIQENFCHSPYALKMRLGSVSTVGGDRQMVPLARSRILRWAGGGPERAEEIAGAMAHGALWLQEGGSCTCPGLDSVDTNEDTERGEEQVQKKQGKKEVKVGNAALSGWYLALAQAEEGRLVLTRLVRWTRGDKELKKFIKALLKQPCPQL
ncbi:secreted frizzled-related protein 2-like [Melanotaenia boesemani]|uniref:secreted frizzled-related protein 2-like n=1 Tax=Melanotaenia boesemani TaxID=1250792 RepID=UPI001C05625B|nr:secreted frizzled-related protein 2-like [Melanotaenia boesemani]